MHYCVQYDLLIAQPAVCENSEAVPSITWKPDFLNQQPQKCLRYTSEWALQRQELERQRGAAAFGKGRQQRIYIYRILCSASSRASE